MANLKNYKTGADTYSIITDEVVVGSNKNFWDLFVPTGTSQRILIYGIYAIPKTDVAVTGTLGVRFDFYKTSSAGTGGTSCLWESPLPNVPTMWRYDENNLDLGVYVAAALFRSAPTGGSNIQHYMFRRYIFPEETNAQTNAHQHYNLLPDLDNAQPLVFYPGEGMLCKQGSVASVNSFTFQIIFGIDDRK